ncbi:L,D-transpeptidase [Alcanivorax sediminis]|uniref:L,D-transpeptidase family protein n=1 Tax=Alcanivorax sediminis TaxID=2663008 RepID=A0A6N7LTI9_9GAMM|nr:L,D-transpeptidase [Alcanivorax sediminis]MQX53653.1 L,D-transpeptidase family protein [Alcanivorax sediminis]
MELIITLSDQSLEIRGENRERFAISSARNGAGEAMGSEATPRGRHMVRARFGAGLPEGAVLTGRKFSGEVYSAELAKQYPDRDWVLTRILWLGGLEAGRNQGGNVDSFRRFIYIHGTPDSEPMGTPASHGCIRMRNADLIRLFDLVPVGTLVTITE